MTYEKLTGTFASTDAKHLLTYSIYRPINGEVKAVLQISHGMCEYIERYAEFASYLCERGIAVCGHEHLGHGEAARADGTLGYFARKDGWKLLPADVRKLTILMQKRFPGKPYFLLGHSMGSFVARIYLAKYGNLLDGAIIMGTSGKNPLCPLGIRLAENIVRKKGERYRSSLLKQLSMGSYNKKFKAEKSESSWLTKEAGIRDRFDRDPLCHFTFTAAGYRDLFTLLQQASAAESFERIPRELPILLVSGTDDPVGNYGKGVREVYGRMKKAGVANVTLKLYEGDRHEILNETDRANVYADIYRFLEEHIPAGS